MKYSIGSVCFAHASTTTRAGWERVLIVGDERVALLQRVLDGQALPDGLWTVGYTGINFDRKISRVDIAWETSGLSPASKGLGKALNTLDGADIQFTRSHYMNGDCDYETYMRQFVTDAMARFVCSHIGSDELTASTDPHMNDIPLSRWDRLAMIAPDSFFRLVGLSNMTTQNPATAVPSLSLSDRVCILKAAARKYKEAA